MAEIANNQFYIEPYNKSESIKIGFNTAYTISFEYLIEGEDEWKSDITTIITNNRVYFKNFVYEREYSPFTITGGTKVGGDITTLLGDMTEYYAYYLFYTAPIIDASELVLPSTTDYYCYQYMFGSCAYLKYAPKLPATNLKSGCYKYMFWNCLSLIEVSDLPATILANDCYSSMFENCTSLSTPPKLYATTLSNGCCASMFRECRSLKSAPELLASTLVQDCYVHMFYGCTSLHYIKMLATEVPNNLYLQSWVEGVPSIGAFVKSVENTTILEGDSKGIPVGWTIYNAGDTDEPEYPETNRGESSNTITIPENLNNSYFWIQFEETGGTVYLFPYSEGNPFTAGTYSDIEYSFDGIEWLPITLASGNIIYFNMGDNLVVYLKNNTLSFGSESSNMYRETIRFIKYAKIGGNLSSILGEEKRGQHLFYNNTYLTEASQLTPPKYFCSNMFAYCTSLKSAPELPMTTLNTTFYDYMFYCCTSLKSAPELPATTMVVRCYDYMFYGCTSLNYIKTAIVNWKRDYASSWVYLVAPTGTFVKSAENTTIPVDSVNGIPIGWTVYNEGDPNIPDPDDPEGGGGEGGDTSGTTGTITSKTITIDGSAQDVEISVEQTNMAIWADVSIEQGDAYATIGNYDFEDSKITLEVTQNDTEAIREIVIVIYGIDNDSNEIEGRITVNQEPIDNGGEDPDNPGGGSSGDTSGDTTNYILVEPTSFNSTSASTSTQVRVEFTNSDGNGLTINNTLSWVTLEYAIGGFLDDITEEVNYNIYVMENTGGARQGTITFGYTDTDNVSHTATYTITQEMGSDSGEDPDNPGGDSGDDDNTINTPEIILYKTRLDYAATGGTGYVQVDYKNATTVLEPTCTQSWVTIEKTQAGTTSDGTLQRQYRITLPSTTITRNASIVFSCTNNVGTVFEQNKFMVYQTGPTTDEVEGDSYILVPKSEITLKEIGESEEIVITYANITDIVAPEVPEGYEITEISRTQIDGNTIEVKYKITKLEESKDDVKVIFKAQGTGGSEVSNNTTIKGWTPPTEPATVTIPSISFNDDGYLEFDYTGGTKTITMSIDGYTKPMTVTYTINDTNNNITITRSELDYDDGYDYGVWDFDITSAGNNGSEAITGTIEIHYVDGLTDKTLTVPFYVRYADEGLISVSSGEFKFDKDGNLLTNYDYIGVSILNITSLNTPTYPDWVTIGEGVKQEGVFYGIDARYNYPISVAANDGVERKGIVTFTGLGKDGKTYTDTATVIQEGTDTEIIIDEGFIELQSLSITLPAEGGSDTFQVKYYDAAEIQMPELENTWATIEEVDSTEENGTAWNGTECVVTTKTYRVTAQSTTSGRVMKVICKMTSNENVYFEKDKFRINQLAPNATGTMGTVFAFSNNITVDSRGFVTGDTIWKEARVGYKDVTIEYPVIDVDWFRIAKIVDKGSSKEYDALKYYELEFDENLSAISRTGTITFKGKNEDGTYTTAIVRVVQLGEEPVDPETGLAHNYKGYFKSLDCTLYSVALITQPGYDSYEEIILAGDSPVVVSYTESDRLYEPLRTSTCTIKVVSSSYLMNLYTGKAQGTQVVVKNEDTGEIKWCGFLQPNLYNQGFSAPVETIEFEASDCLNTLQYIDYSDVYSNGRFVVSFKEIIDDIMDRCKLINSYYVTQKMYSDTYQSKIMDFVNFYISEYNFYSEEEEPWKLKEVLEEICKYMGYVCFQWGDSVYFMDYDMYKEKKMNGARWDKSTRWDTKNTVLISEKANEIVADSYMGTGASMSLDDVFNSVKVNCNYYNVDDLIPDLFEDDYLTNRHGENAVISISRYGGRGNSILMNKTFYRVYDHKYINSLYYSPVISTYSHETKVEPTEEQFKNRYFFRDFIGGNIVDMVHLNYSEANEKVGESKDLERYLLISQLNRPWCGAEGIFHWENYNFPIMEYKNIPVIFIDNTAEDETTRTATRATTSSSQPNTRPQKKVPMPNYLVINASAAFVADLSAEYLSDTIEKGLGKKATQSWYTYGGSSIDEVRNAPALCFYLEIPQAGWWNGSTWVDYKTHFEVPLEYFGEGADDKKYYEQLWATDKDVTNNIETYLFLGTTGYRIPLPKVMDTTRDMYFAIAMPKRFVHCADSYGGDNTGKIGNAYCFIKDLEMKIVNRNTIFYENDEDEVYENVIDSAFVTEGEEIDLKITSDNYKRFSYSTVSTRTAEDVPTTDIQFYNKNMELRKPEEAIIERYVNQYSTPSIKTSLTLDMSFKPYELITDTYWEKDFVITGQEIDYKNASQTITLLEKK